MKQMVDDIWSVTPMLRFVLRKYPDGVLSVLQQYWIQRSTGKSEWRDVPLSEVE
jgi:hypothetical protein